MKKVLLTVLVVAVTAGATVGIYGVKKNWFGKKPEPQPKVETKAPTPAPSYLVREQEKLPPVDPVLTKRLIDTPQAANTSEPVAIPTASRLREAGPVQCVAGHSSRQRRTK